MVTQEDIIVNNTSIEIPFTSNLIGTKGETPELTNNIRQDNGCISILGNNIENFVLYNIGNMLQTCSIVNISLDVRLDNTSVNDVPRFPIFCPEGDFVFESPISIMFDYNPTALSSKIVIYLCGIPRDPNGNGGYLGSTVGEWHTMNLIWNYNTKLVAGFIDGNILSRRWPTASRPSYTNRPTKIVFGYKGIGYDLSYSIRNFRLSVQ